MKRLIPTVVLFLSHLLLWSQDSDPAAPEQVVAIDTFYHHYIVRDPYRWLENVGSTETKSWVEIQNKRSKSYLESCLNKTNAFNIIDKYTLTDFHNPKKQGDYYFTYSFFNNLNNPALFYQPAFNRRSLVIIDPDFISLKDEILIRQYRVSKDSKLLAYQFSRNGSDWLEAQVVSLQTGLHKKDHLLGLKFKDLAWLGDGFFYSTYFQDSQFGVTSGQRVFYHRIGDEQSQDKLIFTRKNNPDAYFDYMTTADERFFILKEINEKAGLVNFFYIDYQSDQPSLRPLITNLKWSDGTPNILDYHNGKFIATTSGESKFGSIIEIDPENPYKWRSLTAGFTDALLLNVIPFDDRMVAVYQTDLHPVISVIDYAGTVLYQLKLPVATSVGGFSGNHSDEELLFYIESYTMPPVVYNFNIRTYKKEAVKETSVNFKYDDIEYRQVEYLSSDSVRVSMILVYQKGLKLDGNNPAILEAYGGFNRVDLPSFNPGIVYFIKNGGVYAFANIRGGGDKGEQWARDGRGKNKQKSFDDFIAAAGFLIANKYTCRDKLAATGSSNGGLVTAASAIQRPDLFRVAVPEMAPLDMLRLEKFTVGHWNTEEYGTTKDSDSFARLYAYSPCHNIRETVNYPAMLIVTAENDDRVPPFHSYKFAAALQNRKAQTNPILLKSARNSGHHGASTFYTQIRDDASIFGFIMNQLMEKP